MTNLTKRIIEATIRSLRNEIALATAETITTESRESHWDAAEMEARTLATMIETRNHEQQPLI